MLISCAANESDEYGFLIISAHHPDVSEIGSATAAKVPVDIAADPGTEDIVPNLQVQPNYKKITQII